MDLLLTAALVYAVVLVLALAASLIAILVYLWRIGSTLREARAALDRVAAASEPLEGHLRRLRDASTASAGELDQACERLARAEERLPSVEVPERAVETARPRAA